jgi:hypothetical protein
MAGMREVLRARPLAARLFLPASLIFFGLAYWETVNWAMAGLQNLPVIFFSLLSIYLLAGGDGFVDSAEVDQEARDLHPTDEDPFRGDPPDLGHPQNWGWACAAGALAAFSSANGFLVAVVGLWILLRRRAYWACVGWGASFVIPLAAYLYHYVPVPRETSGLYYVARPVEFFAFLGMAAGSFWGAIVAGFAVAGSGGVGAEERVCPRESCGSLLDGVGAAFGTAGGVGAWVDGGCDCFAVQHLFVPDAGVLLCVFGGSGGGNAGGMGEVVLSGGAGGGDCVLRGEGRAGIRQAGRAKETIRAGMAHYKENPALNSPLIDAVCDRRMCPARSTMNGCS